ncbi:MULTISPECIES: peptidoglycan DD-metalloendopeptidase family protein [unclassified Exiguobacterium]|uniref:M23 family metallopeptidase n=1 Tax=unclassified Exiguobacterium TaxID=2644629 RepID=UPI000B593BE7|nr:MULTISPECIES: peptidoglycan DD-metalloendopeptidase family protein [unclassified Exiguobacterium]ASI34890.1 peptidase M23 [Exiguobacterium sp. N4-1P]
MKRMLTTMTMTALMVSGFATTGIEKVEAATTYKVKVMADGLRVRTGPSTAYKAVGTVNKGKTYKYLGVSGSWTKISYSGSSRYVASKYVKKYKVTTTTATKASSGFSRPTSGPITQGYGAASGVYGYTFHNGIDIGAATGTPVYASAAGKVITSRNYGAYGNYVMMTHTINGLAYTTVYAHLNSRSVYAGQTIAKGAKIGTVGATGNAFGAHLHFELHRGSYVYSASSAASSINPLNYFN